ncbi:MAG TPA: alpha-amylase family glycosyl hydrolase [Polyangia bacterium]|nr:alpha-amylase family glycosyl hydrolase [Polyangia bacterium]
MRRVMWLVVASIAGCGPDLPANQLPSHPFDPGSGHSGDYGSGSGAGSGTMPSGPPMCAEPERRCPETFSYTGAGNEQSVTLIGDFAADGWTKGVALSLSSGKWTATIPVAWNVQVTYKFHVVYNDKSEKWLPDPTNAVTADDGFGGKNSVASAITCTEWTCVSTQIACPGGAQGGFDWRDAVMYFVFVDRFLDGNPANDQPLPDPGLAAAANWQGGDWAGVTQKIQAGYFQSLGVNTLWLSVPVDQSESTGLGTDGKLYSAYHAYWPRDLTKTEQRFGSEADLQALVAAAHAAGLKVVVDYAMHHVHKDSPTWQAHMNDGWFHPLDVTGGQCICGSSACPWDGPTAKTCWFMDYLPAFDFTNSAARAFSVQNTVDWITKIGFDGFRLDAIKHVDTSWLTDLRAQLTATIEPTSKQHVYLVGETYSGDQTLIKSFVDPCAMLDGQFDFPLRATLDSTVLMRQGKMSALATFMDSNTGYYGAGVMSTFIGNHDVPRSIHFAEDTPLWTDAWTDGKDRNWTNQPSLVGGTSAYERVAVALALLMTNRGVPMLYYGDEIGLPGAGDPDNRRFMQWSGYSAGQSALLQSVQKLGAARAAHPALRRGDRATVFVDDETWAYKMSDGSDVVYVALNRADAPRVVNGLPSKMLTDALTGAALTGPSITVPPRTALILPSP